MQDTLDRMRFLSLTRAVGAVLIIVVIFLGFPARSLQAQPLTIPLTSFAPGAADLGYSRVAVGPDGSIALAVEIHHNGTWKIAVQRYGSTLEPVGPLHLFESCGIFWTSAYTELPELLFHPTGYLIVVFQQTGDFDLGGDSIFSSEIHVGLIDPSGQRVDTAPGSEDCVESFVYYDDGSRADRPRFDLTPNGELLLIADGFFGNTNYRNVAIQAMDNELNAIDGLLRVVPHVDELSAEALHWYSDIATNGSLLLATWHECPFIDNQGNYSDCDVKTQFASITETGLVPVGGNQPVNVGDAPGTLNILASADMNASGNSVVVWLDARVNPNGAVFGQRFNASGQPIGANFQISAGQQPFPPADVVGYIYRRPEVAMLDDGRFMAVWTEVAPNGTQGIAMGRRYSAAGVPFESPQPLVESGTLSTAFPHVVSDGTGFIATWIGVEGQQASLFLATFGEPVAGERASLLPENVRLDANYPNPFSESTMISFEIAKTDRVRLTLHDLLGREVQVLVDEVRSAGHHSILLDARDLPSGAYFYQLEAGQSRQTRLATLMR